MPPLILVVNIFLLAAASSTPILSPRSGSGFTIWLSGMARGFGAEVRGDEVGVEDSRVRFLCISMLRRKKGEEGTKY